MRKRNNTYELRKYMQIAGRQYQVFRKDLIYPELSFAINGVLFEVFKELGGGHQEKYYQEATRIGLAHKVIPFREQYYVPLTHQDKMVGKYYLDFLIDDKIVLELKRGRYIPVNVINQAKRYLVTLNLPLAIIACFAQDCVVPKRIVNHEYRLQ